MEMVYYDVFFWCEGWTRVARFNERFMVFCMVHGLDICCSFLAVLVMTRHIWERYAQPIIDREWL
jgi:hypothetical protein